MWNMRIIVEHLSYFRVFAYVISLLESETLEVVTTTTEDKKHLGRDGGWRNNLQISEFTRLI